MTVQIPPDLQEFVRFAVTSGAYNNEGEVVAEALELLRDREQVTQNVLAGIAQLDAGEIVEGEVVFAELQRKAAELSRSIGK